MSKILIGVGVCGQPVRIFRAIVAHRNFRKQYLKLVVEETIVLDGLRMLVPQFVDDKAQSFVVTSRFRWTTNKIRC